MKYLFLLIGISFNCFADNIRFNVTVDIASLSDTKVRIAARHEALISAMEKLPVVVTGHETLSNDSYEELIHGIGLAYADITVNHEQFNRSSGKYSMSGHITIDHLMISKTLQNYAEGATALRKLRELGALASEKNLREYLSDNENSVSPFKEARLAVLPYFWATSYSQLQQFETRTLQKLTALHKGALAETAKTFEIRFTGADVSNFYFDVKLPKPVRLKFKVQELENLYEDKFETISANSGGLCLFIPTQNILLSLPEDSIHRLSFNVDYITSVQRELIFEGDMKPMELISCSPDALDLAVDFDLAEGRILRIEK
tara:strand:+ start:7515 stop:8465 length:951 start_codon:yes stop_codon:yes gene_type:complete